MRNIDVPGRSHRGFRTWKLIAVALLSTWFLVPQAAAGDVEIEFTGFLKGLPDAGLTLPPSTTVTATIQVPVERDSTQVSFDIDFTPLTEVDLETVLLLNGQLVKVELVLQSGRLVVKEIDEVEFGEVSGTATNVPGDTLTLPVSSDQTVILLLGGLQELPLNFTITPRTETELPSLKNGDQVDVKLGFVAGRLIAVEVK